VAFVGETVPSATPPTAVLVVISWAGMRGVISLAVALSLPLSTNTGQPVPGRDLIVFVTFAVILVTLIGQGLTLPALVRRMGVGGRISELEDEEVAIRLRLARVALQAIDGAAERTGASPDVVERVRGRYADRIERLERRHAMLVSSTESTARDGRARDATAQLLEDLTEIERGELQRLQNASTVDQRLARRLQQSLDLQPLRGVAAGPSGNTRPSR
jgi:CPA1 family monovalent cation:H+ antiporter